MPIVKSNPWAQQDAINVSLYNRTITGPNRYIVSGELTGLPAGTVTSIALGSNLAMQPSPITVTGSIGLANSLNIPGDVQISGNSGIYGTVLTPITISIVPASEVSANQVTSVLDTSAGAGYYYGHKATVRTANSTSQDLSGGHLYGLSTTVQHRGASSSEVNELYGIEALSTNTGGGTVQSAYGIFVNARSTSSGVQNNAYGVYIGTVDGTNQYGVYQSDATNINYWAGTQKFLGDTQISGNTRVYYPVVAKNILAEGIQASGDGFVSYGSTADWVQIGLGAPSILFTPHDPDGSGRTWYLTGSGMVQSGPVQFNREIFMSAKGIYSGTTTSAAGRYVTSGELTAGSSGTVTNIALGSNLAMQPSPITTTGSIGLTNSLSIPGDVQISGTEIIYTRLGVGQSPSYLLHVRSDASTTEADVETSRLAGGVFGLRRYRGTTSAPTMVSGGDALGQLLFYGYDALGAYTNYAARILCAVDGPVTSNFIPARIAFQTTDLNGTARERFAALAEGNRITGNTQVSGIILTYAPIFHKDQTGANRYLPSGELATAAGTGTVTSISLGSNLSAQPNPITTTGSIGLAENIVVAGIQVSGGGIRAYGHISDFMLIGDNAGDNNATQFYGNDSNGQGYSWILTGSGLVQLGPARFNREVFMAARGIYSGTTTSAAGRYVTSGELAGGSGSVTSIVAGSNLSMQPSPITTTGSIGLADSLSIPGDVQMSGAVGIYGNVGIGNPTAGAYKLVVRGNTDTGGWGPVLIQATGVNPAIGTAITLDPRETGTGARVYSLIATGPGSGPGAGALGAYEWNSGVYAWLTYPTSFVHRTNLQASGATIHYGLTDQRGSLQARDVQVSGAYVVYGNTNDRVQIGDLAIGYGGQSLYGNVGDNIGNSWYLTGSGVIQGATAIKSATAGNILSVEMPAVFNSVAGLQSSGSTVFYRNTTVAGNAIVSADTQISGAFRTYSAVLSANGSFTQPSLTFANDTAMGFFRDTNTRALTFVGPTTGQGSNRPSVVFTTSGRCDMVISASGAHDLAVLHFYQAGNPIWSYYVDANQGWNVLRQGEANIISASGSRWGSITFANRHLAISPDGQYDIGYVANMRPRYLHVASGITTGGYVTIASGIGNVIAPGAGKGMLRWEAGTNAGTLKLVGYAGTSTTGVTIADNIGSGS